MKKSRATVIFSTCDRECDLDLPLDITANEMIYALNQGFGLRIDMNDPVECYMRSENPIGLLRGDSLLEDFGIHDGTRVIFDRGKKDAANDEL